MRKFCKFKRLTLKNKQYKLKTPKNSVVFSVWRAHKNGSKRKTYTFKTNIFASLTMTKITTQSSNSFILKKEWYLEMSSAPILLTCFYSLLLKLVAGCGFVFRTKRNIIDWFIILSSCCYCCCGNIYKWKKGNRLRVKRKASIKTNTHKTK